MKSIVSKGLEPKKEKKKTSKILKTSLALVLIVFAFTMSSPSSYFQIVKPAEAAGTLTGVRAIPTSNIVNERATYDFFFGTATTGTIKFIHMTFPSGFGFDVSAATKLIERSGIGSGSLSSPNPTTLIYTVTSPVSVPAGTTIRLEIGRIQNSNTAGSFKVGITTENTVPTIIDGPTQSSSFPIKSIDSLDISDDSITGSDVSTSLMILKTLNDNTVGHAHGWNPNGATTSFTITDTDISGSIDSIFVSIIAQLGGCVTSHVNPGTNSFDIECFDAPPDTFSLLYIITKLPPHQVVSSSASATPFASSQDTGSISRQDETASEFP